MEAREGGEGGESETEGEKAALRDDYGSEVGSERSDEAVAAVKAPSRGESLEFNFESNTFQFKRKIDGPLAVSGKIEDSEDGDDSGARSIELSDVSQRNKGRKRRASQLPRRKMSMYPSADAAEQSQGDEEQCCEVCCGLPEFLRVSRVGEGGDRLDDDDEDHLISYENGGWFARLRTKARLALVYMMFESSWVFLCILGVTSSVLAWCIDEAVALLTQSRAQVADLAQSSVVSYLLWTLFTTLLAVTAVFTTAKISPLAAGSGIPQMRSILGGFSIPGYLSLRTLVSKVTGLLLALGSGMVIGKEGPFVHISCIIANQMLRIPIFAEIRGSPALRKQILAAACAVGVSSTFGAPIGGVLFSIEVTSSLYQTSEYWKGFFCVVCGAFVFKELSNFGQSRNNVVSLFTTSFEPLPYTFLEIPLFVILSIVCGYLGGCFVLCQKAISDMRQNPRGPRVITNSYSAAVIVAVLSGTLNYPLGDFMQYSLHFAIDDLLVNSDLSNARFSLHWDEPTVFINLVLFASIKFILAALAINLPIPCGVFTPLFAVGAALGRFFGELILVMGAKGITAAGYAVIGSSAFVASATGSVSTAVIVFELTNQLSYMLPVLLAVLIGQATGRRISLSIYESLAKSKNLPSFPHVRKQNSYSLPVAKVMRPLAACIPRIVNAHEIEEALLRADNYALDPSYSFAIVDRLDQRFYLGSVTWKQLHLLLRGLNPSIDFDLLHECNLDESTISIPTTTPLNDAINFFDVHKKKSFFVVRRGVVVGKLYLRDIAKRCDDGIL